MQDLILLFGRSGGKFFGAGKEFADASLQAGQTFAVGFLVLDGEGRERVIDEINYAGFPGAGSLVGRNNARGDGIDFGGFLGREELEFLRRGRLRSLARMLRGGDERGPVRGKPNGADGAACTGQELPTTKIVDHKNEGIASS